MYTNTHPDRKVIAFPDIKQIKMLSQLMLTRGTQCSRTCVCSVRASVNMLLCVQLCMSVITHYVCVCLSLRVKVIRT